MGIEDQLRNVPPLRSLPKEESRVLEMTAGGFAPAKSHLAEKPLKSKHKCPFGGSHAATVGCDPAVDNGSVEAESSPLMGSGNGSSDCACLVFRSLRCVNEDPLDGDELVIDEEDDGNAADLNAPGSSTPSDQTTEEMVDDDDDLTAGYETPTERVFNSFAPGPEELGEFAPLIPGKGAMIRRVPLRRQLQFNSSDSSPSPSDEDDNAKAAEMIGECPSGDADMDEEEKQLLGSLYATHYNFILSTLLEEQSEQSLPAPEASQSDDDESPRTPPAVPIITGIAETCPGAPFRHVSKARKLDPAICRKLDFS